VQISPLRRPRLTLRPGVHLLRRSADELQVGLDPARALVLPDRPDVRALLALLTSPASPRDEAYDECTLHLLADSGMLVDADTLLPLVPDRPAASTPPAAPADRTGKTDCTAADLSTGTGPVSRADIAALAASTGDDAERILAARARIRVEVLVCGSAESAAVAATLTRLLGASGLPHRLLADGEPCSEAAGTGVLVAVGEPARERLDPWLRGGTSHLVLRLVEGHAVVGPFVRPGETACLRCVDAHHTDVDPAWPLLVAQYAAAVIRRRDDTVPEPVDSTLATLAAAWAARELVSHAEGRTPATNSTTIRLDPYLTTLETQCWPRHPACGCAWS
jgi:bacteriocin biosynthesis cyclodehydratase domain-containing protein